MKFEYEKRESDRECVAYMYGEFLYIQDSDGDCVVLSDRGVGIDPVWNPDEATYKFYPGDKVTITF